MRKGIWALAIAALLGWGAGAAQGQSNAYPNPYGGWTTVHTFGADDPHGHYLWNTPAPPPRDVVPEMPGLWPCVWPWYAYGGMCNSPWLASYWYDPYRWPVGLPPRYP